MHDEIGGFSASLKEGYQKQSDRVIASQDMLNSFLNKPLTCFFGDGSGTETDMIYLGNATHLHRNYLQIYDMIFTSLLSRLNRPLKILEVGCTHHANGSAQGYCKMPYVDSYVGIDIEPQKSIFGNKGKFIQGDAYTSDMFNNVKSYAPFDLIIDDASHLKDHQIWFFKNYKLLGGNYSIMCCEDVQLQDMTDILSAVADPKMHGVIVPYFNNVYLPDAGHILLRISY